MMPLVGGQELQGILSGVPDGLEDPCVSHLKNCTGICLRSALFWAYYKVKRSGQEPVVEWKGLLCS